MKFFIEYIKIVLVVSGIGLLLICMLALCFDSEKFFSDLFFQLLIQALVYVVSAACAVFLSAVFSRRSLAKQRADMESYTGIVTCSPFYYLLPAGCILITGMMVVMTLLHYEEMLELYQNGRWTFYKICPFLFAVGSLVSPYYLSSSMVFYSDYSVKVIRPFRKNYNFRWNEIRQIQRKGKNVILITNQKKMVLSSELLTDGWEEFMKILSEKRLLSYEINE